MNETESMLTTPAANSSWTNNSLNNSTRAIGAGTAFCPEYLDAGPSHVLDTPELKQFTNAYVSPTICALTLIANSVICTILLSKRMRGPTNMILAAIAICDAVTVLSPTPYFVKFFMFGLYQDYIPISWCVANGYFLRENIPTITHTSTIWLTVYLAIQRYIFVSQRSLCRRLRALVKPRAAIVILITLSVILHAANFIVIVEPWETPSLLYSNTTVIGCRYRLPQVVACHVNTIYMSYYISRVILVHLIPCLLLTGLNVALLWEIRRARKRRKRLRQRSQSNSGTHQLKRAVSMRDHTRTTRMLVIVMLVFLVVESLNGLYFTLTTIEMVLPDTSILPVGHMEIGPLMFNLLIGLVYPINLIMYCSTNAKFRATIMEKFNKMFKLIERLRRRHAPEENNSSASKTRHRQMDVEDMERSFLLTATPRFSFCETKLLDSRNDRRRARRASRMKIPTFAAVIGFGAAKYTVDSKPRQETLPETTTVVSRVGDGGSHAVMRSGVETERKPSGTDDQGGICIGDIQLSDGISDEESDVCIPNRLLVPH